MKLGDGKWVKKQPGKRTIRTRKAGVNKGQGWEQREGEEQRDKERNGGRGNDNISYFTYILSLKAQIEGKWGIGEIMKTTFFIFAQTVI